MNRICNILHQTPVIPAHALLVPRVRCVQRKLVRCQIELHFAASFHSLKNSRWIRSLAKTSHPSGKTSCALGLLTLFPPSTPSFLPPLPLPPSLPASAPSAAGGAPPRPGASEAKHPRATCNSPLSLNEQSPLTFCLLNINGGNSASDQIRGQ